MEGIQAKKRGRQCDDCLKQNDDSSTSDSSSIWPPSVITLDQRDGPPRPAIRRSMLGVDSINTEPGIIALSYSKSDSIATPQAGNVEPKSAKSTYGYEDRSNKNRPEMLIPYMEGMSDDLLQILTDDSDKSGRMMLLAEVGIGALSLEMTQTLSKDESIHDIRAVSVYEKPWDETSVIVPKQEVTTDAVNDEANQLEAREASPTTREDSVAALTVKVEDTGNNTSEGIKAAARDGRDPPERSPTPSVAPFDEQRTDGTSSTLESIERRMRLASMRLNAVNASAAKNEAASAVTNSIGSNLPPSPLHERARSLSILINDEEEDHEEGDENQENKAPLEANVMVLEASGTGKYTAATEDEAPLSETSQKIIGDNEICSVVETVSIEDDSPWNPVSFVCCRGQMED
jgi:hypothetical protein